MILFIIAQKILILRCDTKTKHAQDLYAKKYKMLVKEIQEDLIKWKVKLCSWI